MKLFISWSGNTSQKVATILRDWIPGVIQAVKPYVSSEDIDKGSRWSTDIATELDTSLFGIICLTKDNINAPWINYEAGALGKSVERSNVSPFLFRIKPSDLNGPLIQYQSTKYDKNDILKLLESINACCGEQSIKIGLLKQSFEVWWPQLKIELDKIPEETSIATSKRKENESRPNDLNKFSKILEELLEISRTNNKILRDPETLIPSDYLQHAIQFKVNRPNKEIMSLISMSYMRLMEVSNMVRKENDFISSEKLAIWLDEIGDPLIYLYEKYNNTGIRKIR